MRKLLLMRHAKSSWEDRAIADHDRPLNPRGRRSAPLVARWLARRGHLPDTILCSSARRAQDTVAAMREALPCLPEPVIEGPLYHATPEAMRARLAKLPRGCENVLVVGHNPALQDLVRCLADGREEPGARRAFENFPTAAAAVFEIWGEDWSSIAFGQARLVDFVVPRELMNA